MIMLVVTPVFDTMTRWQDVFVIDKKKTSAQKKKRRKKKSPFNSSFHFVTLGHVSGCCFELCSVWVADFPSLFQEASN